MNEKEPIQLTKSTTLEELAKVIQFAEEQLDEVEFQEFLTDTWKTIRTLF